MPVTGDAAFLARLKRATVTVPAAMDAWANESAEIVATEARFLLDDGAILGAGHKPSIAPAPPNSNTRNLAEHTKAEDLPAQGQAAAISDAEYSLAQEYGYSSGNLPERPFMRVACANKRGIILQNAKKAVNSVVK